MIFLKEFLRKPKSTGAILPSSKVLAHCITPENILKKSSTIIEIGCGTGIFTKYIVDKKNNNARFFAIDKNKHFINKTKKLLPDADIIHGSVHVIKKYMDERKWKSCDLIISGLPFAAFNKKEQMAILSLIYDVLSEKGYFLTFAYTFGTILPSGRHLKNILEDKFSEVKKTTVVWKNIPPAFVYICKKGAE